MRHRLLVRVQRGLLGGELVVAAGHITSCKKSQKQFVTARFAVKLAANVRCGQVRQAGLYSKGQEKRRSFNRAMEGGVVNQHQWGQIWFPIQGRVIYKGGEIFGNGFVGYLGLAIALWVISRSSEMGNLH